MKVFDISGNMLAEHDATTPIMVGQGTFFDFDPASLGIRGADRAQLRVEVELEPTPGTDGRTESLRPEDVLVTVEVFDNASGKTMFVIPATVKGFNTQPEPPIPVGS